MNKNEVHNSKKNINNSNENKKEFYNSSVENERRESLKMYGEDDKEIKGDIDNNHTNLNCKK